MIEELERRLTAVENKTSQHESVCEVRYQHLENKISENTDILRYIHRSLIIIILGMVVKMFLG